MVLRPRTGVELCYEGDNWYSITRKINKLGLGPIYSQLYDYNPFKTDYRIYMQCYLQEYMEYIANHLYPRSVQTIITIVWEHL